LKKDDKEENKTDFAKGDSYCVNKAYKTGDPTDGTGGYYSDTEFKLTADIEEWKTDEVTFEFSRPLVEKDKTNPNIDNAMDLEYG